MCQCLRSGRATPLSLVESLFPVSTSSNKPLSTNYRYGMAPKDRKNGEQQCPTQGNEQSNQVQPLCTIYRRDLVSFFPRVFINTKYRLVSRKYNTTVSTVPAGSLPRYMFKSLDIQVVSAFEGDYIVLYHNCRATDSNCIADRSSTQRTAI